MKTTTFLRILFGGAVILSCAVVPLWITRESSSTKPETDLVVLPPGMSGPYKAFSPAAVWVYQQQFGSLFLEKTSGLESDHLEPYSLHTAEGHYPVILWVDQNQWLPNQMKASPGAVLGYLQMMLKPDDLRYLVFPKRGMAKRAILDESHLLLHVARPGKPEKIESLLSGALRGAVRVVFADRWFRFTRPGGDSVLAASLRETLGSVKNTGPYQALSFGDPVFVGSRWIGIPKNRSGEIIPALTVPLAGNQTKITWPASGGFRSVSADSVGDLSVALQKGDVSAGFLWKVPEGVSSAQLPVSGLLSIVFNMKSGLALRLQRYLNWKKRNEGKKAAFSAASRTIRVLCRQNEIISRQRSLDLALQCENDGVRISVELVTDPVFQTRLASGDFDVVLGVFPLSLGTNPGYWWHSSSPGNFSGYRNPRLDSLLEELKITADGKILEQVRYLLQEKGPWVVLEEVTLKLCGSRPALRRLGFPSTR